MIEPGPRTPASDVPLTSRMSALLVTAVFFASLACAALTHQVCADPGPPVDHPEPGTALASYCTSADVIHPWLLTLLPTAIAALGIAVVRRRRLPSAIVVIVVLALTLANVLVVGRLTYAYTI